MVLGDRIKQRLKELGLSQTELARRIDIAQASMNYICSKAQSGTKHAYVIAQELQVSVEWLTGRSDQIDGSDRAPILTSVQTEWLALFEALPKDDQAAALRVVRLMVAGATKDKS